MLVDYLGLRPLNLTLNSGKSFYAYPKQRGIQISEQDWHLSKRLKPFKSKQLFRVTDEGDNQPEPKKKSVRVQDLQLEAPQLDTAQQPETLVYSVKTNAPVESRPVTAEDKKRLIVRKNIKFSRKNKDTDEVKN